MLDKMLTKIWKQHVKHLEIINLKTQLPSGGSFFLVHFYPISNFMNHIYLQTPKQYTLSYILPLKLLESKKLNPTK